MLELSRTLRFCLNGPEGRIAPADTSLPGRNTFSSWPAMRGFGRFYELHVLCLGDADPLTGYFINIRQIDVAARKTVLPYLLELTQAPSHGQTPMGLVMQTMISLLQPSLQNTVDRIRLQLSPYYSLEIRKNDMTHVILRQQFEFSAAHRLHVPSFSDEQNRDIFGKCNNPAGHGHNYRVEVAVRSPIDPQGQIPLVEKLDALVDDVVIKKFDHKHLNVDIAEFATLNPSVENIVKVTYDLLAPKVSSLGVELEEVTVWETAKTFCTYRG
jgi:6-pyruvoyltetrahydropterin/6-carboxytetrahydropterin synthase